MPGLMYIMEHVIGSHFVPCQIWICAYSSVWMWFERWWRRILSMNKFRSHLLTLNVWLRATCNIAHKSYRKLLCCLSFSELDHLSFHYIENNGHDILQKCLFYLPQKKTKSYGSGSGTGIYLIFLVNWVIKVLF